jgi:hypothetical protein
MESWASCRSAARRSCTEELRKWDTCTQQGSCNLMSSEQHPVQISKEFRQFIFTTPDARYVTDIGMVRAHETQLDVLTSPRDAIANRGKMVDPFCHCQILYLVSVLKFPRVCDVTAHCSGATLAVTRLSGFATGRRQCQAGCEHATLVRAATSYISLQITSLLCKIAQKSDWPCGEPGLDRAALSLLPIFQDQTHFPAFTCIHLHSASQNL